MKCPYCGEEVNDETKACPFCGKELTDTAEGNDNTAEQVIPETHEDNKEEEKPLEEESLSAAETPDEIPAETEDQKPEEGDDASPETVISGTLEIPEAAEAEEVIPVKKNIPMIIGAVLIVIAAVLGLWFFMNRESPAERTVKKYLTIQNELYEVKSVEELTQIYRDLYSLNVPTEEYYEKITQWYGVENKDQLFSEMAEMQFDTIHDMDETVKNRSKFSWTIEGSEIVSLESVWNIVSYAADLYGFDPYAVGEIQRFDLKLTDMAEDPLTVNQAIYVYEYSGKWYVMQ